MYERIVVGTDGSTRAEVAVRHAVGLASRIGAALDVVVVISAPRPTAAIGAAGAAALDASMRERREFAERAASAAAAMAGGAGVDVTTHVVEGAPAERLAELADRVGADLIVVGNRGLDAAGHYVTGSVGEAVAVAAQHQHVLVVHTGE
jgi:nucleotide-binding universal stress UspA family protein